MRGIARLSLSFCPSERGETAVSRFTISIGLLLHLRHTCASWLVSAGQPLPVVRDLLGHSTVQMTERYAHLAPENVRAAVSVLDGVAQNGHASSNKALAA